MKMKISEIKTDSQITLKVQGRVDTVTSPELQKEILLAFQKTQYVTLDFEEVEYVSSAGLRALLIGQKTAVSKRGVMEIDHVREEILEVLHMTGFDKILTIK